MSVQYYLSKPIKVKELETLGFNVEEIHEENCHPYLVKINKEDERGVAISQVEEDGRIAEFEGRFSVGGLEVIKEICTRARCLFLTDEDIDNKIYEAMDNDTSAENKPLEIDLTEADYLYRARQAELLVEDDML